MDAEATVTDALGETEFVLSQDELARVLLDASEEGVFLLENDILECNQEACRIFAASREDLLGRSPGLISPDRQPSGEPSKELARQFIDAALAGATQRFSWRHRRFTGEEFDALITLKAIAVRGRKVLFASIRDVSDRVAAEARARRSESSLRAIAESTPAGVAVVDEEDAFRFVNESFARMLGSTRDGLQGRSLAEFVDADEFDRFRRLSAQRQRSASSSIYESAMRRSDGSRIDVLVHASPLFDRDGAFEGVTAVVTDLTERKRIERELVRAREEALAATRAKSAFLANMSHEIRTPLNAVLGMAELLEDETLGPRALECVSVIKAGGRALLDVIGDVLDLSRIESGALQIQHAPFDARDILREVVASLRPLAAKKGIDLFGRWDADVPGSITSDAGRFRQVLVNLVGNAIKFTDHGGVAVELGCEGGNDGGRLLVATVLDTGCGIEAADHARIFEPFAQVDGTSTRQHGGAGLGLAIARTLATALGGQVNLESSAGRGSAFSCSIPVDRGGAALSEIPAEPSRASPGARAREATHLDILLVEDNPINQLVARRMLERAGHRVTTATSGAEALALLERQRFAVVLMDIQMPGMDGLTAVSMWRKRERELGVRVPVIALTAHAVAGDAERFLAAGMDGYVSKPVSGEALVREIGRVLVAANDRSRFR